MQHSLHARRVVLFKVRIAFMLVIIMSDTQYVSFIHILSYLHLHQILLCLKMLHNTKQGEQTGLEVVSLETYSLAYGSHLMGNLKWPLRVLF